MGLELLPCYLEVNCFFDRWVHGASVRCPLISPGEDGLFAGRNHQILSLCLPSSAHLSASSFKGSPRWAFIIVKTVRRPCSTRSRRSCTMSLIMLASGFSHVQGDFSSLIHVWEEDRKHAESERRITGFLSCFLLASLEVPVLGTPPLVPLC